MNYNKKYLKYKFKYLLIKGGTDATVATSNYVNPEKMQYLIEILNTKDELKQKSDYINEKSKNIMIMEDYINSSQFVNFPINPPNLILDCKHKVNIMNFHITKWFSMITMIFFFSDKTRVKAQQNLLPMIINIKNNNLSEKQNNLLKFFFETNEYYYFENGKLNKKITKILYLLFVNLYKNLFLMLKYKDYLDMNDEEQKLCYVENTKCHLTIMYQFIKLFPNEENYKEVKDKIHVMFQMLKKDNYIDIKYYFIYQPLDISFKYLNLYSILLLDCIITHDTMSITKNFELSPTKNIIGYIINNEIDECGIFQCNNKYYQWRDIHKTVLHKHQPIREYDIKKIAIDYSYNDGKIISLNIL